jgi:hypothetical protein
MNLYASIKDVFQDVLQALHPLYISNIYTHKSYNDVILRVEKFIYTLLHGMQYKCSLFSKRKLFKQFII